jgi:tetratricopeptide (TPR) repeat protein
MEAKTKSEHVGQGDFHKEEAFTHLAQGKRHLLVKDYNEAVTSFTTACELLSQLYGETANECGEAYFNYGIALLELARTESGVLEIECEDEDSQDSDGEDEVADKKEEGMADGVNVENGKGNGSEFHENEVKSSTETESKNVDDTNGTRGVEDEIDKSAEDIDGDISNLRLAWEMLELAKIIFKRQAEGNKQMNLKLAEVHLKLGEVGLESETYTQAIEDIKTCLEIQTQNLNEYDRCIAETHYQLGMAYALVHDFDEAIGQLSLAHQLLEKRIEYLQERGKEGFTNAEQNENPFYKIEDEIAEINGLLPDVSEKINDMKDFKKEAKKVLMAGLNTNRETKASSETVQGTSAGSSGAFPVSSQPESDVKPVSDISHLVRKKRKLEPDSSEGNCSKQPCSEVSELE